jgi:hypothetical protein
MATTSATEICCECDRGLEHCHGTAIVHFDGSFDCTDDPDCKTGSAFHVCVITCDEEGCCGSEVFR